MDAPTASTSDVATRNPIDQLSREELLAKYKGLLGIAKKAKQAKDELSEENRQLKEELSRHETQKEADKKALLTMKEMLDQFTENKLQLTTQLSELQSKSRNDDDTMSQLIIENESLKRQLHRITEDNDGLLAEIDRMENQLNQVNLLGLEQKKHLEMLELEVNKLKETEAAAVAENKALKESENVIRKQLDELQAKHKRVKEINSEQRHKFNALKDRFLDMHRKLKKVKECRRVLLETQHEYAEAVSKWQNEIIEASQLLCAQMNALKRENEQLLEQLNSHGFEHLPAEKSCLNIQNISARIDELQQLSTSAFKEQCEMSTELESLRDRNRELSVQLEQKEVLAEQTAMTFSNDQIEDFRHQLMSCQQAYTDLLSQKSNESISKDATSEKYALAFECIANRIVDLDELCVYAMHEQRAKSAELEALKAKIVSLSESSQQSASSDAEQQIENLQQQLQMCQRDYEELVTMYNHKQQEHTDLLDEMRELNEALKGRGDVISRQQEKQQELVGELKATTTKLNQIEENLNDKDKTIAEKIEQVLAIRREVDVARSKVTELEAICAQSEEQVRALTNELQSVRHAAATIDMQSDTLSTSTISRADEVSRMRDIEETFEDKYNKLRALAVKLKKKMQEQNLYIEKLEKQQQSQKEAPPSVQAELEHELSECKQSLEGLQHDKEQQQKLIDTLKAELQKIKSSRKQVNVLNLEIEAAEKSLSETSGKLTAKIEELQALNETLTLKENTIAQLRKQIDILESDKQAECTHAMQLKEQTDRLQAQLKDAVHHKQQTLTENKQLEQSLEGVKLDLEEMRMQVANGASMQETTLTALKTERDDLQQKIVEGEEALRQTHHSLVTTERALEDLRIEYLDYKVKAQAVLRKNQQKDTTKERELEEELVALRSSEAQLQTSVSMQAKRLEECDKELDVLREDVGILRRRNNELLRVIEELREQNEHLAYEGQTQLKLQQEAVQNHRQQIANINSSYQAQIVQLEGSHRTQVEKLQAELAKAVRTPPTVGATATLHSGPVKSTATTSEQSKIDFLLMEREDAEGSEAEVALQNAAVNRKISNASRRSQHDFMPLEELLNAPMHAINDAVVTTIDKNGNGDDITNAENAIIELQTTRARLQIQESRLTHLTTLLAENEQDLAKLTQMNDMLKEELRRQERSEEREKHMHNSEYLKNVIIKFLTLNSADERARLVPVLNTILKLSRTETDLLQCAAKGQREPHRGGWSSFMPSWGGGGASNTNNNNSN